MIKFPELPVAEPAFKDRCRTPLEDFFYIFPASPNRQPLFTLRTTTKKDTQKRWERTFYLTFGSWLNI